MVTASLFSVAQDYEDEKDLKKGAEGLFEEKKFTEAAPLYSQLVSLYPKDPEYNYKYGACLIYQSKNPKEAIPFLEFATSKPDVDPKSYFYLGKAYHLNYRFKEAIDAYKKFQDRGRNSDIKELDPQTHINMCKSGVTLLRNLTDLVVYDQNTVNKADFFRSYDVQQFGGKLIVKPEGFMTDYEKKNNLKTIIFLPDNAERIYFSRIEDEDAPRRDIYYADKQSDGSWGEPAKLTGPINTAQDEDYPFLHPNGRTLYFASKGHNSMGGYDIFRSFLDGETGQWSEPVNVDFAINTPQDDYLFITDKSENRAYFTSDRNSPAGKVNVYKIGMKRVPIDFSVIDGDFTSPTTDQATITVEDLYSNKTIGTFETGNDGSYEIKLPSSGRFRFLVEQENSMVTHAGTVELKNADTFKPLKQKMEIVAENGEEKLIITNLLDEEPAEEELPLSVEMLRKQADLTVNYQEKEEQVQEEEEPEGPELIVYEDEKKKASKPRPEQSLDESIAMAKKTASSHSKQAESLEKQAKKAEQVATEKEQQAEQKLNAMTTAENSGELRNEAETLQQEAAAANDLSQLYTSKAKRKKAVAGKASNKATALETAKETGKTESQVDNYGATQDSLYKWSQESNIHSEQADAEEVFREIGNKRQEKMEFIENQAAYADKLEKALEQDENEIKALRGSILSAETSKRKQELHNELEEKETDYKQSETELQNTRQAVEDAKQQLAVLDKQQAMAGDIYKETHPGTSDEEIAEAKEADPPVQQPVETEPKQQEGQTTEQAEPTQSPPGQKTMPPAETGKSTVSSEYNYESDYNEEFFLPVPDGASLPPATASVKKKPELEVPKPVSVESLPQNNEYAGRFAGMLSEAESIEDEVTRENQKADLMDKWADKLDTDITLLKHERNNTNNESKKQELNQEIEKLEEQKEQIDQATYQTYERVSKIRNPELSGTGEVSDPVLAKQLEYQNLENVSKSSYHKEYDQKFGNLGEIENDYIRLYKTRELNQNWLNDINAEISQLEEQAAKDTVPERKRIAEQRLASLNRMKNLKESEIQKTNQGVLDQAFNTDPASVPRVQSGNTRKRAESLAAESQEYFINAVMLNDSASKVDDPELQQELSDQADANFKKADELADQASDIYTDLSRYTTSSSKRVSFAGEDDMNTTDVNQMLAESKQPEKATGQPTETERTTETTPPLPSSTAPVGQVRIDQSVFTDASTTETNVANLADYQQSGKKFLEASIRDLSEKAKTENDPEKKAALMDEVADLKMKKDKLDNELAFSKRKKEVVQQVGKNAINAPDKNGLLVNELMVEAETLYEQANDSIDKANGLRQQALDADGEEKERLLRKADILEQKGKNRKEQGNKIDALMGEVKDIEKAAKVRNQLPSTISDFNLPTTDTELTSAETAELKQTEEFDKYANLRNDYKRALKEAEVMYGNADKKRAEAKSDLDKAASLREQASNATDAGERKRLIKEAEVVEQSAKDKMAEAENMEAAAIDLSENAILKKKELESLIDGLSPEMATKLSAYEAAQAKASQPKQPGQPVAEAKPETQEKTGTPTGTTPPASTTPTGSTAAASSFYEDASGSLDLKYDPNTKSIFKIGDENTAYYNEAQPIQFDPEMPTGLVYKVQVGAFSKRVPPGVLRGFAPITAENAGNGLVRYTAGLFEDFGTADVAKDEIRKIGYSDAFVVAYYNGKRVTVSDARDMQQFAGAQSADLRSYSGSGTSATGTPAGPGTAKPSVSRPPARAEITPVESITTGSGNITDMSAIEGTFYTVQVGVYSKPVSRDALNNISPLMEYQTSNGYYRYNSGVFDNVQDAIRAKERIVQQGISDAFVTAYDNRSRVTPSQASDKMSGQGGANLRQGSGGASQPSGQQPNKPSGSGQAKPGGSSDDGGGSSTTSGTSTDRAGNVTFRVQVGAYKKDIPVEDAKVILGLTSYGVDIEESGGLTKYVVGSYKNYGDANNFKEQMVNQGLNDAFVVAFENGKRIDTQEARKIKEQ